ncbi:MAG: hypothetical protein ACUVXI_09035, partial [bacterium]
IPVSIAGGNLDIVVFHKRRDNDERYKITIIELKKGKIGKSSIEQMENYVKWAAENLTKTMVEKSTKMEIDLLGRMDMVQPVLIGKGIANSAIQRCRRYILNHRKPILISYDLDHENYRIEFNRITY